jgi:hypothetical protein
MTKHTTPRKPKSGKYTGALAEPIYLARELARFHDANGILENIEIDRAIKQRNTNLLELFKWYTIDPGSKDRWKQLAIELAQVHVPGMRIHHHSKPRRGPKVKRAKYQDGEFLRKVEALKSEKGLSIAGAIRELLHTAQFRSLTEQNLLARYGEIRRNEAQQRKLDEELSRSDNPLLNLYKSAFGST